jgi:hypothetical protein
MGWNAGVRRAHRALAIAFTLIVAGLFAAPLFGEPAEWLYYLPLAPLGLLIASGLWLFALPCLRRRRGAAE